MTESRNHFNRDLLVKLLLKTIQKADQRVREDQKPRFLEEPSLFQEKYFKSMSLIILDALFSVIHLQQENPLLSKEIDAGEENIVELLEFHMRKSTLKDIFKHIYFTNQETTKLYSVFDLLLEDTQNLLNKDTIKTIDILKKYNIELPNIIIQEFEISRNTAKYYLKNPLKFFYLLRQKPAIINQENAHKKTLSHYFSEIKYHQNLKIILHLLFNHKNPPIDLTRQDCKGNTALHSFLYNTMKKNAVEAENIDKYIEVTEYFLENAIKKSFDFNSIKNRDDFSVKQLIFVYKLKILFDINYVKLMIDKNNDNLFTPKLFSSRTLNPITILEDYDKVILENKNCQELHLNVLTLIHQLESIRDCKSFTEKLCTGLYLFFRSKKPSEIKERQAELKPY